MVDPRKRRGIRHQLVSILAATAAAVVTGARSYVAAAFTPPLDELDLTGVLVSADALHTQRAQARFLVKDKNADYPLTVKDNQPTLLSQLNGAGLPGETLHH